LILSPSMPKLPGTSVAMRCNRRDTDGPNSL
jgi:hypothetical protein